MSIDLNYTYLSKLGKDELIQLFLLVNASAIQDKRKVLEEAIENCGRCGLDGSYRWIRMCGNQYCLTIVDTSDYDANYGFNCPSCDEVFCDKCSEEFHNNCFNCDYGYCKTCIKRNEDGHALCHECYCESSQ